jgi:hypothetical protein
MEVIVKIDAQGRINLPAAVLDALHFTAPGELRAQASSGKLELTPANTPSKVEFVKEKGLLVAVNLVAFDAVSAIDSVRSERL